jgi:hypothetical protein
MYPYLIIPLHLVQAMLFLVFPQDISMPARTLQITRRMMETDESPSISENQITLISYQVYL